MKRTGSVSAYSFLKRALDLLLSLFGLLLLSPLFLVIIIILKLTGEGEVFYLQKRMGFNNQTFFIYKFATMLKDSPNIGGKTVTVRNDPRITKFGKLLRMTKINELPQIINVVKGDMALVGPRPLLVASFKKYSLEVQNVIYKNRPGITGIGSLIFRDEELLVSTYKELGKDPLVYYKTYIYPYKGALEQWYYNHCSLHVDFKILFLTFWSLVSPNSELVYKTFKNLPSKPESLTVAGIKKL
ncbi:sugar transferase [Gelidibacter maritimus]|uniref:Sugar transferase n=1 Tax=Gelidibacter maritimus TaxID=2761487 RepID=A0A7W2R466_9FLAO|nr:sugar transferase [Gelidibacter maritimus]MBA6153388.1 sugar transferase [Gelidibacter maritimus]